MLWYHPLKSSYYPRNGVKSKCYRMVNFALLIWIFLVIHMNFTTPMVSSVSQIRYLWHYIHVVFHKKFQSSLYKWAPAVVASFGTFHIVSHISRAQYSFYVAHWWGKIWIQVGITYSNKDDVYDLYIAEVNITMDGALFIYVSMETEWSTYLT